MKDLNLVKLTGNIFWSKLDDRQSFSILRLGVKLNDGSSLFCSVNNPSTKVYDLIKPGNKVVLTTGYLDTWEKQDGTTELQVKANDSGVAFFPKEKALADLNSVSVVGKVLSYDGDSVVLEMMGDRNPKTDKPSVRKAKIKIGGAYGDDIVGSKIMIEAKITSTEVEGKSKMAIEADYDKISIL
jgi:hypothetical protein